MLSVSGEYGIINQIEFQGRSFAGESVAEYHVVETNDIVYTKSPLKANPYGIIKVNNGAPGIVSTLYAVYHPCEGTVAEYIDYYFGNDLRLNKYLKPLVNIGAKHDMKVNNETVLTGEVYFPGYSEQKKIVGFLTILDERIRQQRNLVEALKKYKRGVITYIFSGKCNKFAAEATWTEKTLADLCCEFRSGRNISASLITETGEYAVYGGNGIRGYCDHYSHEGEYVVVGRQGALCGNVRLIQGKNYLSEHAIAVQANDENDTKFLLFLLYFMKLGQYSDQGAQPGLAVNKLLKLKCTVPDKEIQSKIASFLLNIDLQISNHEKMLSFLVDQRKAFLQQLFI